MSLEYSWGSAGFGEKGKKGTFVWGGPASCHDNGPGAALQVRLDPGTGGVFVGWRPPGPAPAPCMLKSWHQGKSHAPHTHAPTDLCQGWLSQTTLKRTYSRGWLCLPDDIETDLYQGWLCLPDDLETDLCKGWLSLPDDLETDLFEGLPDDLETDRGGSACQTTLKRTYARGGSACQTTLTRRSATSWNKHCANRTCTHNPSIAQPEHQVQRHGCNQQAAPRHL